MKPARFAYFAPTMIDEVVALLGEHRSEARILAGGQSLVRLMNAREATPAVLVDINRVAGLDRLDVDDAALHIGATVRQRTSELSVTVHDHSPLLADAGRYVAHPSVRARGTVVGSVCFSDPSAELPTALLALDGEVIAHGTDGERAIAADDFFTGPYTNTLADDEFAVAVRIPASDATRTASAFLELSRRHGELPVCGVAVRLAVGDDGQISEARIALGSVATRPVRARDAEAGLVGAAPGAEVFRAAGAAAAANLEPFSNCHGDARFRKHLAAVLTERALGSAATNLKGEPAHV
jgi:carbon-monoxide dehydrogenase medium subunit